MVVDLDSLGKIRAVLILCAFILLVGLISNRTYYIVYVHDPVLVDVTNMLNVSVNGTGGSIW